MSEKYEGNVITIDNLNKSKAEIIPKSNAEQETREGYNYYDKRLAIVNPNTPQNIETTPFPIKKNTTYTFYANGKTWLEVRFYDENDNIIGQIRNGQWSSIMTFTTPENTKTIKLIFYAKPNVDLSTYDFTNVMLLEGTYTTDTLPDYEQYGASPSPEFPSEVKTVGQNVNIFNILDYTATLKVTGEAKIFDSNNFRVIAKYSTDSNCMTMFRTIDLTNYAGKILTIQAIVKSNTDTNKAFIVLRQNNYDYSGTKSNELYDESQNTTDGVITLKYKVVDTINDNNRYLFMGFYATRGNNCNTGDYVDYKVKMVEGTEVGGYSPYGQGSVEIEVCNKNLFDKNTVLYGYLNPKTGNVDYATDIYTSDYIKINPSNKYYLPTRGSIRGKYFNKNKKLLYPSLTENSNYDDFGILSTGEAILTNIPSEAVYIRFSLKSNFLDTCYLVTGEKPTNYIPHESYTKVLPLQKEFVKINDTEDTFVKVDGKWYEKHYSLKIIFDGTEGWTYDSERYRFYKTIPNSLISQKSYALSSHFKNGNTETDNNAFNIGTKQIFFRNESIASTSDWKTWLAEQYNAGTPVIVYYILETPELIECTAEQSNILDQLENTELYDGINHITAFSSIEPMLEVTVKEPIEDYKTYISSEGYLINNEYNIKFLIDFNESNLPSMPEATESSIRAAGRNGDIVLATTYEPMTFDIVCYTEDNLTQAEKTIEEKKINKFLNSIKNKTITLAFENDRKFYNVKYSGALVTTNFPKHLKFSIPLKSSESYGKDLIEKSIVGNDTGESDTIENAGALITINGPAIKPIISLNDYSIEYDMDILEGAKIEIDSSKSTITHINSDGIKTNVMKYYNHQFPKIENGTNQLKILSGISNANNVMVKWNDLKL